MSIYRSHRDRSLDNDMAWERVLSKGSAPRPVAHPVKDWSPHRKASPFNGLLPVSRNWLRTLPVPLQPRALATKYPRIVNLIAQHWHDGVTCHAYLDQLLVGGRPNRLGFPPDVRREILGLREYFVRGLLASRTSPGSGE
ncbi:MAG: hypothetical protein ABI724_00990 [Betaproteobacteria bacterium]